MKIIALGDTHGRTAWKETIKMTFDKVIFIGDYFDSYDISFKDQLENFVEICNYKRDYPDKVVLLIGNHDYHYLQEGQRYSGYQSENAEVIKRNLEFALQSGRIQACTVEGKFLFSHAGVTKTWAKNALIDLKNIEGSINKCMIFTPQLFKFMDYQNADSSGDNIYQSPIWVRPKSLLEDMIEGYTQVVGHTQMKSIILNDRVIFIDTLGQSEECLQITDGKAEVMKKI